MATQAGIRTCLFATGLTPIPANEIEDSDCPICLDPLCGSSHSPVALKNPTCTHIFHAKCLTTWLETSHTCPMCRTSLWQTDFRSKEKINWLSKPMDLVVKDTNGNLHLQAKWRSLLGDAPTIDEFKRIQSFRHRYHCPLEGGSLSWGLEPDAKPVWRINPALRGHRNVKISMSKIDLHGKKVRVWQPWKPVAEHELRRRAERKQRAIIQRMRRSESGMRELQRYAEQRQHEREAQQKLREEMQAQERLWDELREDEQQFVYQGDLSPEDEELDDC